MRVVKKNGNFEDFDDNKLLKAVEKSAKRASKQLTEYQKRLLIEDVKQHAGDNVKVSDLHIIVEQALRKIDTEVAQSYMSYRDYKQCFISTMNEVFDKSRSLLYGVDRENSNFDSNLISTKNSLIRGYLTKELYKNFFLSKEELQAIEDGYVYFHDLRDMLQNSINCCLFDIGNVLKGGFEMANIHYSEPTTVLSALQVIGDVTLVATAQQFGGFTLAELDKVLLPYVEKSIAKYKKDADYYGIENAEAYVTEKVQNELRQGFQSLELKLNTVPSSRGDFAFNTITFGDIVETSKHKRYWQIEICKAILNTRMKGHGKAGIPAVFPKLVYLYSQEQHDREQDQRLLFDLAIKCSGKAQYPDYLSLDGDGPLCDIYRETGKVVSGMGCRAYLSDFKGENGESVFIGRANIGACALHLPMIWQKSQGKNFYADIDYYMNLIREFLKKRYDALANQLCSSNPLGFCQGGLYKGNKKPYEKIGYDIVKSFTASFGITALNELNVLMEGKMLHESDRTKINEVVDYILAKINQFKKEDGYLYAAYGVPAESLAGTQREQFVKKFGIIENVSDRPYLTNSFHTHVSCDISMFDKQDCEYELFHKITGGHIQYVRVENRKNLEAIKQVVLRGMRMGLYQGINIASATCEDCGYISDGLAETCESCGSDNLTIIARACGYLSFYKRGGDTRFNDAKVAEIKDRVSM